MKSFLSLKKIWEDDDILELLISVSDGKSYFQHNTDVANLHFSKSINILDNFGTFPSSKFKVSKDFRYAKI